MFYTFRLIIIIKRLIICYFSSNKWHNLTRLVGYQHKDSNEKQTCTNFTDHCASKNVHEHAAWHEWHDEMCCWMTVLHTNHIFGYGQNPLWPTKKCKMFNPTCHVGCLFWVGPQHGPELGMTNFENGFGIKFVKRNLNVRQYQFVLTISKIVTQFLKKRKRKNTKTNRDCKIENTMRAFIWKIITWYIDLNNQIFSVMRSPLHPPPRNRPTTWRGCLVNIDLVKYQRVSNRPLGRQLLIINLN